MKSVLQFILQLLAKISPAIAGWIGGPFGAIAGWILSWLVGKLYDLIVLWMKYLQIDTDTTTLVEAAQASTAELVAIQNNPNATEAQHAKALQDFITAHSNLSHIQLY